MSFLYPIRQQHRFNKLVRENVLLPIKKIIWRRKLKFIKNKYMKFHNIVIHSPSYSPVLQCFLRIPTTIMRQVTFNTERQRYEFVDSPGDVIGLYYVIYHENHNKYFFKLTLVNWGQHPSLLFFLVQNLLYVNNRHLCIPRPYLEIF